MAFSSSNVPPSAILKSKTTSTAGSEAVRQTKDEYRKNKELEEARKAGTAPAEKDEEGRDINPHIPQFITQMPWYVDPRAQATLKHQRPHPERKKELSEITEWYRRGVTDKVATKYRKGACENCGSMTHKKKDCFERPRKIGARFTGDDIAPDEHLQPKLKLNYDAKRDRWNGYDPADHKAIIEEFEKLEETRKMVKAELMKEQELLREQGLNEEADKLMQEELEPLKADEDRYAEDADMPGVKTDMDSRTRITVRNLRIREDTAKYLINLDPESAYYDPKSRSMRENPYAGTGKTEQEVGFAGENFVRFTGEVTDVNRAQLFAWEAKKRGVDVHTLAEPTKLETLKREITVRKDTQEDQLKKKILEEYGGEEHLKAPPKELLLAQTEHYVEYSRKGRVIKGEERASVRSRYEEDVLINNHTHVWGSFWADGVWGFACCHSTVKNSYCVGETGKNMVQMDAKDMEETKNLFAKNKEEDDGKEKKEEREGSSSSSSSSSSEGGSSSSSESESNEEKEKSVEKTAATGGGERKRKRRIKRKVAQKRKRTEKGKKASSSSSSSSSDEEDAAKADIKKLKEAKKLREALVKLAEEEERGEKLLKMGDRDRPYNSHYEVKAPTEHEMEAFRLRQIHPDDPMAKYMEKKK